MSLQPVTDPTEDQLYCTVDDVATFFEKFDTFDGDTNPTQLEVQNRILAESNWVDQYTNHAWRERTVEKEYHDLEGPYNWRSGLPIALTRRDIRTPFDSSKGDAVELWRGNDYDDFVSESEFEEGRDGDYWVDESRGILYLYRRYVFFKRINEVRVTYRFGKESVPQIIQDSVARRVAAYFLEAQQYRETTPGKGEAPDAQQVAETWREQSEQDLMPFKEVRSTGL